MRIIKFEEIEGHKANIAPMRFAELGLAADGGDNGGAPASTAEQQAQMEMALESARREGEQLRVQAAEEAEGIRVQAQNEATQIVQQAQQEGQQVREQAAKDAEFGKKEGYAAGYSSGEEEGYKKGYEDGYQKGKAAAIGETQATINMIMEVIEQLKTYHSDILGDAQKDIARMALSVARKVIQKEIMTDPMTVVNVVKSALSKVSFKKQFVVNINPLDIEVIQNAGSEIKSVLDNCENLQFRANPQVEAGGCVIQTESGTVDAQIDRQFGEVQDAVMNAMGGNE